MATYTRREEERRHRRAAGLDYSDTAIDAAAGTLDASSSYTSSYDSGSSCSGSSYSSSSGGCD